MSPAWVPLHHPSVMQNLNPLSLDDSNGKSFEGPGHLSRCYDGCWNLMLGTSDNNSTNKNIHYHSDFLTKSAQGIPEAKMKK